MGLELLPPCLHFSNANYSWAVGPYKTNVEYVYVVVRVPKDH